MNAVVCYPVAGKRKSVVICEAFARGCGGLVVLDGKLRPGAAMFYGVDESNLRAWRAVLASGKEFFYADNSYFDQCRQRHVRLTRNHLQCSGLGESDGKRFAGLGIKIRPWRKEGRHLLLCPQSRFFMDHVVFDYDGDWTANTIAALRVVTDRPIRVREWDRNKAQQMATFKADLAGAHALVTWSSSAAVTALLEGVPVVTMGQSAAAPQATPLDSIEEPMMRDDRAQWASVLADNEFSYDEMREGTAWRALN